MWLERLEITNYRCFEKVELDLPETGLILITGRNNAGKSALLKAIDELFAEKSSGSGALNPLTGASVVGTFCLTDDERASILGKSLNHELDPTEPLRLRRVAAGPGGAIEVQPWTIELHTVGPTGRNSRTETLEKLSFPGTDKEAVKARIEAIIAFFAGRRFHFDPIRPGSHASTANVVGNDTLRFDGSDLAEALLYLASQKHPAEARIQELLAATVPDAGTLITPVRQQKLAIEFRDAHRAEPLSIKQLGTGVEQLVMAAYAGLRHEHGALLMLEEPEAHLHAGAQRQLAQYLLRWAERHQILVATHSPIFMDARSARTPRILLVERNEGVSRVREASDDLPDVLRELGVRLSDVLSADRVLVVEGPSDQAILETWFGERFIKHRVSVVVAAGGDLSFKADKLIEWIEEIDLTDRKVVFLRDRDELPPTKVSELRDKGVHVLEVRELENYLCDPQALRTVLPNVADWDDARVLEELREIADSLRPVVLLKRVAERLPRPRILGHREVGRLARSDDRRGGLLASLEKHSAESERLVGVARELWEEVSKELDEQWKDDGWAHIAPGEEMLEELFRRHGAGAGFDKQRRGPELAAARVPPHELVQLVDRLVGE